MLAHDPERGWQAFEVTLSRKDLTSNIVQDFGAGAVEVIVVTRDTGDQRRAMDIVSQHHVTVYPDKLVVKYFPPVLPKKKDPGAAGKGGRGLSVIDLAVPKGLEPVSSA